MTLNRIKIYCWGFVFMFCVSLFIILIGISIRQREYPIVKEVVESNGFRITYEYLERIEFAKHMDRALIFACIMCTLSAIPFVFFFDKEIHEINNNRLSRLIDHKLEDYLKQGKANG